MDVPSILTIGLNYLMPFDDSKSANLLRVSPLAIALEDTGLTIVTKIVMFSSYHVSFS